MTNNTNDIGALYDKALAILQEHGEISCVLIQRKLYVGYATAREIMDKMLQAGVIIEKGFKGIPTGNS
jgi:DNA segregation ATPase FtsK/SpoIIIE-like protein